MIARNIDYKLRFLDKKLEAFFGNAPFDCEYYVTPAFIRLRRLPARQAFTLDIDLFEEVADIISSLKGRLMLLDDFYPRVIEPVSILVKPDPEEIMASIKSDRYPSIEDAVVAASTRVLQKTGIIERINPRANQVLVRWDERPRELAVNFCRMPVSKLLEGLRERPDLGERWRWFASAVSPEYVIDEERV